jgi:hypothetical protein
MSRSEGVIWCDGCGVEINWAPLVKFSSGMKEKSDYCCEECYSGFSCQCGERMEMEDEHRDMSEPI